MIYDLIIVGCGPAGASAALYASRGGLKTLILEKGACGGQLLTIPLIENYPGFGSIRGAELAKQLTEHAKKFGAEIIEFQEVVDMDLENNIKKIKTLQGTYKAKSVLIATGTQSKKLNLKNETELIGKGISYCAVCDGPFFKDKKIAVVGGGNSALEEADYLAKFAKSITLIHRRKEFSAEKILKNKISTHQKIKILLETVITEIIGNEKLEAIKLKNLKTNQITKLETDGLFIYIGRTPNTNFVKSLTLDENKYIITDNEKSTNIKGVFAAGDVTNSKIKQIATAVSSGVIAAISAEKYLSSK